LIPADERRNIIAAVGLLGVSTSVTLSVPMGMKTIIDTITEASATGAAAAALEHSLVATAAGFGTVFVLGAAANAGRSP
jgi:hypothetical protein